MEAGRKDIALEALRGLAAVAVLLWHCMFAFFPERTGVLPNAKAEDAWLAHAWFGIMNGNAAVVFFFVLSGYVLTRGYFASGDDRTIVRGAVKRWPRLAVPVLAVVMVSYALFALGAYHYEAAGEQVGSMWLTSFAFAASRPFEPGFWDALSQGTFLTFFRGDSHYDSNLWTMRYEFIGSYMAFGLALMVNRLPRRPLWPAILVVATVTLLCGMVSSYYVAFPVGVGLAAIIVRQRPVLPLVFAGALLLVAFYLAGYMGRPLGAYRLLAEAIRDPIPVRYVHIAASVMAILAVEACAEVRRALSVRAFAFLGEISFPLYLIHIPVICSGGCLVYLAALPLGSLPAAIIAAAVSFAGSFVAAFPLMMMNRSWLAILNRFIARSFAPRTEEAATPPSAFAEPKPFSHAGPAGEMRLERAGPGLRERV